MVNHSKQTTRFHTYKAENGLMIIAEEMPDVLTAAFGFLVQIGSRDESPEIAGVSHFLEHMCFQGTEKRSKRQIKLDFDRMGSIYNAGTSKEHTMYYGGGIKENLLKLIDLFSDMLRPAIRQDDFDMEKKVVLEEIALADDYPEDLVSRELFEIFFGNHPLAPPILGTKETISALTREQMLDYLITRYSPANITCVVAGNFQFDSVVKLVKKTCSKWEKFDAIRHHQNPVLHNNIKVVQRNNIERQHFALAFSAPGCEEDLFYTAKVLSDILGNHDNSRLYWAIKDKRLADSIYASYESFHQVGMIYIYASASPELAPKTLNAIKLELEKMLKDGVTEDELRRSKNRLQTAFAVEGESSFPRLFQLGMTWLKRRQLMSVDEEIQAIESVTTHDISLLLRRHSPVEPLSIVTVGPLDKI